MFLVLTISALSFNIFCDIIKRTTTRPRIAPGSALSSVSHKTTNILFTNILFTNILFTNILFKIIVFILLSRGKRPILTFPELKLPVANHKLHTASYIPQAQTTQNYKYIKLFNLNCCLVLFVANSWYPLR